MYPYGPYYEDGYCQDRADERTGEAVATGSKERCRTPSGIFDLAGNVGEWVDGGNGQPTLLGGYMSSASGAACNRRSFNVAPGSRNRTTGFRCCADAGVVSEPVEASELRENLESVKGQPVPEFDVQDTSGNPIRSGDLTGAVTLVNFFASWCGPCKKEFPFLVEYAEKYAERGFQIVGVGVDTIAERSIDFAEGFDVNFPIVTDVEARLKGKFLVYEMPATFLVDRQGVIRYSATGFSGQDQEAELRKAIEGLL
jgi:peroxiredoxin